MKKLVNMLEQRSLYDLLQKAKQLSVEGPEALSEKEWQSVLDFTEYDRWSDKRDYLDYYLELAEEDDSFWEVDEDDYDDPDTRESIEEHRRREKKLAKSILAAQDSRAVIAERVAEKLLEKAVMEEYLLKAGDKTIDILKDISARLHDAGNGQDVYSLNLPWKDCRAADILETWGYAVVRFTEARKSEDEHRHVTGITIPEDVVTLFREVFNDELDDNRKNRYAVSECCNLAKMYYETAPLNIVMEIYHRYANAAMIKHLLTDEEFKELAADIAGDFYSVLEIEGKTYVVDTFVEDDWEDVEKPEDSILYSDLENIRNDQRGFYIPPVEEILEFFKHGWWPSRQSYQKLQQWFTEYYLDEKAVEGMFPRMLEMFVGEEEADYYRGGYTMDDVEADVNEKMFDVVWFFMSGSEVQDVLSQMEEITAAIHPDAKERLMQIMEECRAQTNKTYCLGHYSM